jgi:hypothetical protein
MAIAKKVSTGGDAARQIKLAGPAAPFQLVQTSTGTAAATQAATATKPVPADPSDPTGVKNYIAFSVAHAVYPQGPCVNPDQDISDDVKLNSDTIAAEVNVDAQHSATIHQLSWTSVTAAKISTLNTVGDLVNLIKANLK